MATLHVERIGGLAGFGGPAAHIQSRGQIETESLSSEEQHAVEALFQVPKKRQVKAASIHDGFRYRISRVKPEGTETIEAPESAVPHSLARCVKDEIV